MDFEFYSRIAVFYSTFGDRAEKNRDSLFATVKARQESEFLHMTDSAAAQNKNRNRKLFRKEYRKRRNKTGGRHG